MHNQRVYKDFKEKQCANEAAGAASDGAAAAGRVVAVGGAAVLVVPVGASFSAVWTTFRDSPARAGALEEYGSYF